MPRPPIHEGIVERFLSFRHARLATGSGWSPNVVYGEPNNVDIVIAAAHVRPANEASGKTADARSENTGVAAATESVLQIFGAHGPVRADLPFEPPPTAYPDRVAVALPAEEEPEEPRPAKLMLRRKLSLTLSQAPPTVT